MLKGIIRNVRYQPRVIGQTLPIYQMAEFDVNQARPSGIIQFEDDDSLGYSVWVSPKRTRSFPFARIYNSYGTQKKVTIIPIMKDEGLGGDLDRINAITFSWMSLANIYIILAYYADASAQPRRKNTITKQRFQGDDIRAKLSEIAHYHQSALHWNTMHFERDFVSTYRSAINSYQVIQEKIGISMRNPQAHEATLARFLKEGLFDVDQFKSVTLQSSKSASQRERVTHHALESLSDGDKELIEVENMLGGKYYLTIDEVFKEHDGTTILQESKNTTREHFPAIGDLQDGLFKLMLFANMETLLYQGKSIPFKTRLKITGRFSSTIKLPVDPSLLVLFSQANRLSATQKGLLEKLNLEAQLNAPLEIVIAPNL